MWMSCCNILLQTGGISIPKTVTYSSKLMQIFFILLSTVLSVANMPGSCSYPHPALRNATGSNIAAAGGRKRGWGS